MKTKQSCPWHPLHDRISLRFAAHLALLNVAKAMTAELKDLAPLLLQRERKRASDVDVELLTSILRGGVEANLRRKQAEKVISQHPKLSRRDLVFQNHAQRFKGGLEKTFHYAALVHDLDVDAEAQQTMYDAMGERLPIQVHRSMFVPTLENQADEEQQAHWLPLARQFRILGAYAQTELGHGSNVQGLETTATYDARTEEFVIDSPTLTSRKWWPGGLGKTATHAIVHAQLCINGERKGVQAFIVPLRSLQNHLPLPGVEVGDIGPKVGFNSLDNGYAVFHGVRIPRRNMLMRYAKVLPDGTFVKPRSSKLVYLTMTQVRAYLILKCSIALGAATTITTRFSAVRLQGRKPNAVRSSNDNLRSECQVLDYQNQQLALLPLVALAYAANFAGRSMVVTHDSVLASVTSGAEDVAAQAAELHAVSSGLKAWVTSRVSNGIEHCRQLCGGHGFLQSSNLAHLFAENVGSCTFEGTFDVLVQQHARYLLKALDGISSPGAVDHSSTPNPTDFLKKYANLSKVKLRCTAQCPGDIGHFEILRSAFEVRAARSVQRLSDAMKVAEGDGNSCMLLMARASTHHTELMLLKSFIDGVQTMPTSETKAAVAELCQLFGVWLLSDGLGDFREDDYVSSEQGDMVHQQLLRLLPGVRRNAVRFTDAWDFTDFELNSAIGKFDGDIYRALVAHAAREPLNASQVPEGFQTYLRPLLQSAL